jgi:hypothetical protein
MGQRCGVSRQNVIVCMKYQWQMIAKKVINLDSDSEVCGCDVHNAVVM